MRITKLKSKKKRTESSRKWLLRQLNDKYVQKAQQEGYHSRAAYKLIEMDKKYHLLKAGHLAIDLGCAPGSWSQVMRKKGLKVIGVDLLPVEAQEGCIFLEGDFTDIAIQDHMADLLNKQKAEIIVSDMAPNACGMNRVDALRLSLLIENAVYFCKEHLKPQGTFLAKVLRGGAEAETLVFLRKNFEKIHHFKPTSSRKNSAEVYVVCLGFKGTNVLFEQQ